MSDCHDVRRAGEPGTVNGAPRAKERCDWLDHHFAAPGVQGNAAQTCLRIRINRVAQRKNTILHRCQTESMTAIFVITSIVSSPRARLSALTTVLPRYAKIVDHGFGEFLQNQVSRGDPL